MLLEGLLDAEFKKRISRMRWMGKGGVFDSSRLALRSFAQRITLSV
jgi:hypothetical protein